MTCIIAINCDKYALIAADSQATLQDQGHQGFQKIIVGDHYMLGGAGNIFSIHEIFLEFSSRNPSKLEDQIAMLENCLERYSSVELELVLISEGKLLKATPAHIGYIHESVHVAGQGNILVSESIYRDRKNMYFSQIGDDIVDSLLLTDRWMQDATRSIYVDWYMTFGVSMGGRNVLLGDDEVNLKFAPESTRERWTEIGLLFEELHDMLRVTNTELLLLQEAASRVRSGSFNAGARSQVETTIQTVEYMRGEIKNKIDSIFEWY